MSRPLGSTCTSKMVEGSSSYRNFIIGRSRSKIALFAKASIIGHVILPPLRLLSSADSDASVVLLTALGILVANMFILKATSSVIASWFTAHPESCVVIWSLALSSLLSLGLASEMYKLEATSDFYSRQLQLQPVAATAAHCGCIYNSLGEAEQRERDVVKAYSSYTFLLGTYNLGLGMMALYTEALHFRAFVILLLLRIPAHAYRSLVLHPILVAESPVLWAFLNYVLLPATLSILSWNADKSKLEAFRQQQVLNEMNRTLTDRLQAAEKALAFEAPTQEEQLVVGNCLKETGREFKNISIPFESLEFQERIGAGSCGEVIKASYNNSTVAVKRLVRSRINKVTLYALVAEVRVLRKLRHPNVVNFVGLSWDNVANVCLVLEYLERGSLADVLQDKSIPLSWADPRLKMATDIVAGVVYLHARRTPVIHRDLKPSNVLVTPTYGCKLADFGASRLLFSKGCLSMTQIGTWSYMAPEMIQSGKYDEKVDIYAIGIMLATMHTRLPPYYKALDANDEPKGMLLAKVVAGIRPRLPDDMPPMLVALAKKCWAGDPEERPTSTELVSRLRSLHALIVTEEGMTAAVSSSRRASRKSSGTTAGSSRSMPYDEEKAADSTPSVILPPEGGGGGGGAGGG